MKEVEGKKRGDGKKVKSNRKKDRDERKGGKEKKYSNKRVVRKGKKGEEIVEGI